MRAHALTLHWHNDSQPIYSAHFQPTRLGRPPGRLATAGGDNNVRIWRVEMCNADVFPTVTYLATLIKHTQAVNVVRFDFSGEVLASAGDDGNVILWSLVQDDEHNPRHVEFGEDHDARTADRESWRIKHLCRSSVSEIYDLAWSPDSQYLVAGSMDNVARIYSAATGVCVRQVAEHNHYVQGVAWDPLNEYIATQSSDRSVHIYTLKTKDGQFALNPHHKISRAEIPVNTKHAIDVDAASSPAVLPMNPPLSTHSRRSSFSNSPSIRRSPSPSPSSSSPAPTPLPLPAVRQLDSPKIGYRMSALYHHEGLASFFRRLSFTPDGSLLLTPAGQFKYTTASGVEETTNTVYIYSRAGLNRPPVAHLPSLKKPALVTKCCPLRYKLRRAAANVPAHPTQHMTIDSSAPPALDLSALSSDTTATADTRHHPAERIPTSTPSSTFSSSASDKPAFVLPYRIVYAVATQDSVIVYDTEQSAPLCVVSNLHYAAFTDLTWSVDARILFMTSTDGFCSVIVFDHDELGEVFEDDQQKTNDTDEHKTASEYYPPTPASADESAEPTPIIVPVPGIAAASSSSQPKRSTDATSNEGGGEKKKKRVAPTLVGDVRPS
ncbi:WD40-repeat-containing domain protein [Limtongia smithiae]|uniref:WD40-repeat-containing domain protein n=1 Tax=Limtongia smithiae TaxID=1125753 RepID=UPI0034CDCDF6